MSRSNDQMTKRPDDEMSGKLPVRRRLLRTDPAGDDVGAVVVLAAHRSASEPPEQRQLADMGERVGNRTLEDPLGRRGHRGVRCEVRIEPLKGVEKARDFTIP